MRVIGTAGHVDHGKSTLVRALTGIDPDRLKEEKARGMTIDLGFAWMELSRVTGQSMTVGIVDVPGHLDFIKNMLAGVGGIDAAVLVIAADEGVMPQTREHLAILDLLAVPALVVALTKVDVVDDAEWLDLVEMDVAELLIGTRFAGADVVRVAALAGFGLTKLRDALGKSLEQLPPRRNRNLPRLPIDRVFTLAGFGTVVTGTLSDGDLSVGQAVELLPSGRAARIRGMHSHNRPLDAADPGRRLALNLSGVDAVDVRRGEVVVKPGALQPTRLMDVEFQYLEDCVRALVHNQAVDFFTGASETQARVRILGVEQLAPGEHGYLQLRLEEAVVVAAGDRFILRQPSPSQTLGGGTVLNPHPRRRWRRFDPAVTDRLAVLARGMPEEIVAQTLARHPYSTAAQIGEASGLDVEEAGRALAALIDQGAAVRLPGAGDAALLLLEDWSAMRDALLTYLLDYHRSNPLRRGMPRSEARSRFGLGPRRPVGGCGGTDEQLPLRVFNALVESLIGAGAMMGDDQTLWRLDHTVELSSTQATAVERTLAHLAAAGVMPPAADEVLALLGHDQALLEMLLAQGRLVRVGPALIYRHEEFEELVVRARAMMEAKGALTLAEARDLWGMSRKVAQAVLEEMDARRITRREGDFRVLR